MVNIIQPNKLKKIKPKQKLINIDVLLFLYHISIYADIFEASRKGDLARVRPFVASGESTNSCDNVRRCG
jgi:hypothetical protein